MRSLQFLVRQSEFIRALFYVQTAFRNLTAITEESSAKFFTAISGCNYRNDLKLTHREFLLHKETEVGQKPPVGPTGEFVHLMLQLQKFYSFVLCHTNFFHSLKTTLHTHFLSVIIIKIIHFYTISRGIVLHFLFLWDEKTINLRKIQHVNQWALGIGWCTFGLWTGPG